MLFSFYDAALADLNEDASLFSLLFQWALKVEVNSSAFHNKSHSLLIKMMQKAIWAAN